MSCRECYESPCVCRERCLERERLVHREWIRERLGVLTDGLTFILCVVAVVAAFTGAYVAVQWSSSTFDNDPAAEHFEMNKRLRSLESKVDVLDKLREDLKNLDDKDAWNFDNLLEILEPFLPPRTDP